jgi:CRP/FNR family transcriptional regulator
MITNPQPDHQTPPPNPPIPPDLAVWRRVPWLRAAPPALIAELSDAATRLVYAQGTTLFLEGDPGAGLHLVAQGTIKISRFSKEGREHILHLLSVGDSFNDVSALDGGPNPATAIAQNDVVVYRLTHDALRAVALRHPHLAWALIESLAARARHLVGIVQDLSMRNVRGRLARLLIEQAEANESDAVPRLLTQEEMASRLGSVREVVGRSLRSLANDGIIEFNRHRIVILDLARLRDEADA